MKRRLISLILGVAILLLVRPVKAAPSNHAEIDPRVWQDLASSSTAPLLVRLVDPPTLVSLNATDRVSKDIAAADIDQRMAQTTDSQRGLRAELDAAGLAYRSYWVVNLIAVTAGPAEIERIAARPDVLYIESDRAFPVLSEPTDAAATPAAVTGIEPGLAQVHAPDLWAVGVTGQGRVVASADTGVTWDHPALKPHYRGWNGTQADHNYNWWDAIHPNIPPTTNRCGYDLKVPCDDNIPSHGTHTTGTMIGDDGQGNQIGMAPGATWIACRNMDQGVGHPSTYIECLQFFIAPTDLNGSNPDPGKRPDVIDNSYGCPPSEGCTSTSLHDVILQVRAAGIFMSVSAGNSGPSCSSIADPPGLELQVFTVGAVDSAGNMASFSSRGPITVNGTPALKPDLVAPGVGVRSSYNLPPGSYASLSGTSMAAPHVAGAVALLWSAFPTLRRDINATETLLRQSAKPDPVTQACGSTPAGAQPNNTSGYGVLDVLAAYNRLRLPIRIFIPTFIVK